MMTVALATACASLPSWLNLNVGDGHDVGEYACGCHVGTGSIALYLHGVVFVTLGGEQYDVVTALEVVERMLSVNGLQGHLHVSMIHRCHESPSLALFFQPLSAGIKVGIQER